MENNNLAEEVETEEEKEVELPEEEQQEETSEQEPAPEEQEPDKKEEELQQYSKSVQDRIRKITHKYRDEEAQRKAAVEFAEAVKKQNDELKQRLDALDKSYV